MEEQWQELVGAEVAGIRLERYLAHGGQAAVYVGVNKARRGRRSAVKVVAPHLTWDKAFGARLLEEAQALEALSHPNVVAFRDIRIAAAVRGDVPLQGGQLFVALELELLEGQTFHQLLKAGECPADENVLEWFAQACDGLAAAHALGIIHRDIKPGNLFLCDDGTVKVIDFGIARAMSRADADTGGRLTKTGHTAGTTLYIAPEMWRRAAASPLADVYALGLSLAEVLLRRHPFLECDGSVPTEPQIMYGHLEDDLRQHLSRLNDPMPRPLEDLILRLCARDPSDRPPNATTAAAEIRAARDGVFRSRMQQTSPSTAFQDNPISSPERWASSAPPQEVAVSPALLDARSNEPLHVPAIAGARNRAIAALSFVAVLGVAVLGVSLWQSTSVPSVVPLDSGGTDAPPDLAIPTDPVVDPEGQIAVRVHTSVPGGHLFVDGTDHGPFLGDEISLALSPGDHTAEVRIDGRIVASEPLVLVAGAASLPPLLLAPPQVDVVSGLPAHPATATAAPVVSARTTGDLRAGSPTADRAPSQVRMTGGGDIGGFGEYDPRRVAARVRAQQNSIRVCYDHERASSPALRGALNVEFTIEPSGSVTGVNVSENSVSPSVGRCVAAAIARLQFHPGPTGGSVRYRYSFVFG